MVNFRFSSTIQSFGNGGIWVGSCLIVGVGDDNQLRWFVVNKMINPWLKFDIIMVGRYCWTCICHLEQVCCEPLNLLGVSFLTCYRVLKLLNLDLLGVSFLTCYRVLKLLNLDLLGVSFLTTKNCLYPRRQSWGCVELPSFRVNYFTLLLRSAQRKRVTILDPKVANLSGRREGKSNCVLLTTV